eukprot:64207-Prymnesium_polylepis.3
MQTERATIGRPNCAHGDVREMCVATRSHRTLRRQEHCARARTDIQVSKCGALHLQGYIPRAGRLKLTATTSRAAALAPDAMGAHIA